MVSTAPVIVFGDSSAAVFLIAQLLKRNESVVWSKGSGARVLPVLPTVKSDVALATVLDSVSLVDETATSHPVEKGCFHRMFRNKAFKAPSYLKSHDFATQRKMLEASVWAPEQLSLSIEEYRSRGLSPALAEEQLRAAFESHPAIQRVVNAPILELEIYEHGGQVQFADGTQTPFKQFYFCDSLSELKQYAKLSTVMKHQVGVIRHGQRVSALQVVFTHKQETAYPQDTGFVIPMNRDAGEEFDRDVIGYFLDAKRSVWTVYLKADEGDENHEIMKKLRKLKQSLNRAFGAETDSATEFMKTVEKEQVRFESGYVVVEHGFKSSEANQDFVLMTDSFGFSAAMEALSRQFSIPALQFEMSASAASEGDDTLSELDSLEMPAHLKSESNPVSKEL